jgi:hypothetical protein
LLNKQLLISHASIYASGETREKMKLARLLSIGKIRNGCTILVYNPKRPFGKNRYRWKDFITIIFKKCEVRDWIQLAQNIA